MKTPQASGNSSAAGRGPAVFAVTPDVRGIRTLIVNAYLVAPEGTGRWVLVDGGLPGTAGPILGLAEQVFPGVEPAAVVLTHAHFDHVGAVGPVLRRWPNTPVFVHPLEVPYVTGQLSYPPPDPAVGGGWMTRLSPLFPKHPHDFGDAVRPLPADGSIPHLLGWRWIHTPGHTPGHVSLFRARDHLLLAGDAFVTVRQENVRAVWRQTPEVRPPPAYFTVDWRLAYESMRQLAALDPRIAATGHGVPMGGAALREQLSTLLENFGASGVPARGRYVRHSWKEERARSAGAPQ